MRLYQIFILSLVLTACGDETNIHHHMFTDSDHNRDEDQLWSPGEKRKAQTLPTPLHKSIMSNFERPAFAYRTINRPLYFSTDERYSSVEIQQSSVDSSKRVVRISGIDVTIEEGHSNRFWEVLNNQADFKTVYIEVETLRVRSAVSLPSANLIIKAKNLIFDRDGEFDVTPKGLGIARATEDGLHGKNAPQVEVYVKNVEIKNNLNKMRFIANGGDGQDAGLGIDGRPGRDVVNAKGNKLKKCNARPVPCTRDFSTFSLGNTKSICPQLQDHECVQSTVWPTNGTDARPGGIPGRAGDGGVIITTNLKVLDLNSVAPGNPGDKATTVRGGRAGRPESPYLKYHTGINWVVDQRRTRAGRDASPREFNISDKLGQNGELIFDETKKSLIVDNRSLRQRLKFINDLYRTHQIERTRIEVSKLSQELEKFQDNLVYGLEYNQLLSVETQLNARKNFFGEPLHNISPLSLETWLSVYQSQTEDSIRRIFALEQIMNSNQNVFERRAGLQREQERLMEVNEKLMVEMQKNYREFPRMKSLAEEIKVETEAYLYYVQQLENEISDESIRNVQRRNRFTGVRGIVSTLSALSAVVPVSQPAFMAVGAGLTSLLDTIESDSSSERLSHATNLLRGVNGLSFHGSSDEWNHMWNDFRASRISDYDRSDLIKHANELVRITTPFASEARNQFQNWTSTRVAQDEVQREIEEIKASHPEFQNATSKLESLLEKRSRFDQKLQRTLSSIQESKTEIAQNLIHIANLNTDFANSADHLPTETVLTLESLKAHYESRLEKHLYYLKRAYNYRYLEAMNERVDLNELFDFLRETQVSEGRSEFQIINTAHSIYMDIIAQITDKMTIDFGERTPEYVSTVRVRLSQDEVRMLSKGEQIYINPVRIADTPDYQENKRVKNIRVSYAELDMYGHGVADLLIDHIGHGVIEKNGKGYFFSHYRNNQLSWGHRFDSRGFVDSNSIRPSRRDSDILATILGQDGTLPRLLLAPPMNSDFIFSLERSHGANNLELKEVEIEIDYYYTRK